MSTTIDRLIDLHTLMHYFPKNAILDMTKWTPQDSACGTACCAAGNAIIYLKSWSDHLEFQGHSINFKGTDEISETYSVATSTEEVLREFLPDITYMEYVRIFIHPSTTEEVERALTDIIFGDLT